MLFVLMSALMQAAAGPAITDPVWRPPERGVDALRYYPELAQKQKLEGAATMQCTVTSRGEMTDCKVLSETPAGVGFGDAALRMSPVFRMQPTTKSGQNVEGGIVTIPIQFKLPRR